MTNTPTAPMLGDSGEEADKPFHLTQPDNKVGHDASALLPCPFCGGGARMATEHDPDDITWHYIKCNRCGARSRGKWHSEGNDCPLHRQEVRDEWNQRAAIASATTPLSK